MIKKLVIITGNKSKVEEFKALCEPLGFIINNKKFDLVEPKTLNQAEVAISTAKQAYKIFQQSLVTDDTGIFFDKYHLFPGTYSKFLFSAIGLQGIKRLIDKNGQKSYFQTTLCFTDGKVYKTFQGKLYGKIVSKKFSTCNKDWTYDSIFIPVGSEKKLSEYTLEERIKVSHRSKAVKKLINFLKKGNFR